MSNEALEMKMQIGIRVDETEINKSKLINIYTKVKKDEHKKRIINIIEVSLT